MSNEFKRMQKLAGTPVKKESLNEHYIAGGIVGIGAINTINPRKKSDYEMAFEHFIGEGYDNEYGVDIEEKKEESVEEGLKLDPNMTVEEFMEKLLGPDYERKPQEKRDMVSKVYDELKRVNSIKEEEEDKEKKTTSSTLGTNLKKMGNNLDTKGIQNGEADNFIEFIKKALESMQSNNLDSDAIWKQLSTKLDTINKEKIDKRVNSIKEIKAEDLYKEFEENNLLDDRREYDIEDFTSAYPNLSKKEAEKLEKMFK